MNFDFINFITFYRANYGTGDTVEYAEALATEIGRSLAKSGNRGLNGIDESYNACFAELCPNAPIEKEDWIFKVRDAYSWALADIRDDSAKMYQQKKRMKITLATMEAVKTFLSIMSGETDSYTIENEAGTIRVDAKSQIGVLYASTEIGLNCFLVNQTNDGVFPAPLAAHQAY